MKPQSTQRSIAATKMNLTTKNTKATKNETILICFVKRQNRVTPAEAGVHNNLKLLDSCFRRNDK